MDEKNLNINELMTRLPEGYEQKSKETGAFMRFRAIKNPADLIRLVFLYLCGGYSQLELCAIAELLGIAKLSDTAFGNRFAGCRAWLEWMVSQIVPQPIIEYTCLPVFSEYQIVAVDASDVSEKGRSGRIFRLHYAIDLLKMCCVAQKVTAQKIGETLSNFDIKKNWLILADRIYGTLTGIESCLKAEANFVLRLKHNAFKLYDAKGAELRLLDKLKNVTSAAAADIEAFVKLPTLGLTKLRVCAIKIPDDKLEQVAKRLRRRDSKKQQSSSVEAMLMSQYLVVITALPHSITADEIVALYRYRWQVELYFKRLKSILDFGNVPLSREDSIYTWLNGKLLISLLIEQMLSEVSFSPCNDTGAQHLARD